MIRPLKSEPARVGILYHRASTFGGSFNSVLDVTARIDRARFEPVALLPGPGSCEQQFRDLGVSTHYRTEHRGARTAGYAWAVASFVPFARRVRLDLLYVTDYVTWRSAELLACRLSRLPSVVHVRAPLPFRGLDPELARATMVIGNSEATIRALRPHMPSERLRVVSNFIDFASFDDAQDLRSAFFGEAPPVVGFLGVFRPEKGVEYFLEMARLVHERRPDVRFLAVGGESAVADVGWFGRMRQLACDLGIEGVVHFTGSRLDVPDMMRSMDVLVVPSLNEGFGRVILEANAVGTPVIGANAAGIPEVVEPGITGELVPPANPAAMAEVAIRMLADENWRRRVRADVPARVRQRFAPKAQMSRLHDAWDDALRMTRA